MIVLEHVSFSYENSEETGSLKDISLHIKPGEAVLFCGESGCGKSTLTRLINGLIPQFFPGKLEGRVLINNRPAADLPLYETAELVGSVFQNPRSQFYTVNTTSELAFGRENRGLPREWILSRIKTVTRQMDLAGLLNRNLFELSGGEKQKIACASVSVADPSILVLDEPTSNLDTDAIESLKKQLCLWKKEGKTLVVAEHRLNFLMEIVDRIFYLKDGVLTQTLTPSQLRNISPKELTAMGLRAFSSSQFMIPCRKESKPSNWIRFRNLSFYYRKSFPALAIADLDLPRGEIIGLIGPNGAGKSTFAKCLCGLVKRCTGEVLLDGKRLSIKACGKYACMVMQDVNHQLFTESVWQEVLLSTPQGDESMAKEALVQMNLEGVINRHPMSLSGGQKQRVAIAGAVVSHRPILVLDEPTSGLDRQHMLKVSATVQKLREMGKTILIISHDPEFLAGCCTWALHFEKGRVREQYPLTGKGMERMLAFFDRTQAGGVHGENDFLE